MKAPNKFNPARGFSLIEVLVAVVILSVGLLALASLQLSMIRASGETKAQTIAAGLAKDKIEFTRSFTSLPGYWGITAPVAGEVENFNDGGTGQYGGVNFTRTTKVLRYVYNKTVPSFVEMTNAQNTLTDSAIQALSPNWVIGKDFKKITVDVTWVDATGGSNTVTMEDIVDSLDPAESGDLLSATSNTGGPRKLEAKIVDPALDAMVIPIAVGGGTESAASNPKPTVTRNSGADTVETRFDVLTYSGVNNGTANVQARVETAVAGCFCTFDTPPAATVRGMRPTYWNGFRYAVPFFVDATGSAAYSPKGRVDTTVTGQSQFCGICCRDHMDPMNVKGPTFSPRLVTKNASDVVTATSHLHYLASGNPSTFSAALTTGPYTESCRLIRVDGIWSVAADLENDYFDLLATQELSDPKYYASGSAPDATATTNYQNFVVGYLDARYVGSGTNQGNYNTLVTGTTLTDLEDDNSINLPDEISINSSFSGGALNTKSIQAITRANPGVVTTTAAHGFANDDRVTFQSVGGMKELNNKSYIITGVTSTTFQLLNLDTSGFTAFTSGGTVTVNHAKWLHSRGMFADYLEKDALRAIDNAKTACPSQSGAPYTNCVLQVLPFTSINLTELADWSRSDTNSVLVTNDAKYSDTLLPGLDPIRGEVTFKSGAVNGAHTNVITTTRKSNTSLLDLGSPSVSANDAITFSDTQPFVIGTAPAAGASGQFYVGLSIAKGSTGVSFIVNGGPLTACNYDTSTGLFVCQPNGDSLTWSNVANAVTIQVAGYNFVTAAPSQVVAPSVSGCTYAGPEPGFSNQDYVAGTSLPLNQKYTVNTCTDYNVHDYAVNTTLGENAYSSLVTNSGQAPSEFTRIPFLHVRADTDENDTTYEDRLDVTFDTPTTHPGTAKCTYTCLNGNFDNNGHPTTCKTAGDFIFNVTSSCN